MKKLTLTLEHVKETKGTHVYGTDEEAAAVSQLYIRKSVFTDNVPKTITVTIEEA